MTVGGSDTARDPNVFARAWAALAAWWFAPLPRRRVAWLRVFLYSFVVVDILWLRPWVADYGLVPGDRYQPLMIGRFLPLPTPTPLMVDVVKYSLLACAVVAASGRFVRLAGIAVFGLYLEWMVIAFSYGKVDHDRVAFLVALAVLPTVGKISWSDEASDEKAAWAIRCIQVAVVATYFLSTFAKFRFGGFDWVNGATLLRAVLRRGTDLAAPLESAPEVLRMAQWGIVLFELTSPLLLVRGRIGRIYLASAFLFHAVTYATIEIVFWPHVACLLAFLPLEKLRPADRFARRTTGGVVAACVALVVAGLPVEVGAQDSFGLGAETPLGARVPSDAPGHPNAPAVTRGEDSVLAVWAERPEGIGDGSIVARHLDDRGVPLPEPATVVAPAAIPSMPAVDFGAHVYLVAFTDASGSVVAVRLDGNGQVLDATPITVAGDRRAVDVEVVWLGDAFAVTWIEQDDAARRSQLAALVDPDGVVRTPAPVALVDDAGGSVVAGPPGELLVLWSDYSESDSGLDAYGRRFDAALQPIGERFVVSSGEGTEEEPDAVFDGSIYLVAWSDSRAYPETQIRVATMTAEGVVGEARVAGTHRYFTEDVEVAASATSYDVLWSEVDGDTIHGRRVSGDGTPADPGPFVAYADEGESGVASYDFDVASATHGTLLLVEGFDRRLEDNVYSTWLDEETGPGPRALVSRAANGQRSPAVAGNGKTALVVWQDWRTTSWQESFDSRTPERPVDVYAARLTPSGLVPARGMRISAGDRMEAHPDVAWTGRSYLAAWTDYGSGEIGMRAIARDGDRGPTRKLTGRETYNAGPRVAGSAGRGYVVWFNEFVGSPDNPSLAGAAVDRRGVPRRPTILFDGDAAGWDVAAMGRRFTVVWVANDNLYTRALSSRGAPLSEPRVVAPAPRSTQVRIGGGGGGFLVTWPGPNEARPRTTCTRWSSTHGGGA